MFAAAEPAAMAQAEEQRLLDLAIAESLGGVAAAAAKSMAGVAAVAAPGSPVTSVTNNNSVPSPAPSGGELPFTGKLVAHLTLADKGSSTVRPGERFTKVWRLQNEGPAAYPPGVELIHVGAELLGAPARVSVPEVPAGACVDVAVPFVAPQVPGRFQSYWRLKAPGMGRFGHRVWADVFVEREPSPDEPRINATVNDPAAASSAAPPSLAPAPAPAAATDGEIKNKDDEGNEGGAVLVPSTAPHP